MAAVASPSVRKLAAAHGLDIDEVAAKLGRQTIAREDILSQANPSGASTASGAAHLWDVDHATWGQVRIEPLNRIAQVTAATLSAAQNLIPAVTHHDTADASRMDALRTELKGEGTNVTALSFHIAILARCLREFPRFNASLSADGKVLILKDYVHIGVAVDTPHGLAVPVLRNADSMRLSEIGAAIKDLAIRARGRKLRRGDMGGASMTISNLGGIAGGTFNPIVNPPEVAILGIARADIRPAWTGTEFAPTHMVPLSLSYDHRVINGADAARFLERYRNLVARPDDLLIALIDNADRA